jgi:two-component system sensor histidine kinase TctE
MSGSHSLRLRLLGVMFALFALGLAASFASYRLEVHDVIAGLHARTLQNQARELIDALHVERAGALQIRLPADWRHVYADPARQFTFTVFGADHRPLAWSANLAHPLPYIPVDARGSVGPVEFIGVGAGEQPIVAARAAGGRTVVVARRGMSRDTLVDSLFEEDSEHVSVLIVFAVLALGLMWLISGWSLQPIERASREAALVGPRQPDLRISAGGLPREIQPLVEAVNGALDRLSRAYAVERRLTADAAHELRTPLAVLNLRLQRARLTGSTDWPAVERELSQMGRLVDQLIDLARKESLSYERSDGQLPLVNLSRLIREAAAQVLPLMEAQGRRLEVHMPDVVRIHGRADDLRDMVRNLLDNALVHGRGAVSVRVIATPAADGMLRIEVRDEGKGVPRGQEESVFERFHRLNAQAPGSGLGLAIVRQVARSHGGDARFVPGEGCIVLQLPCALAEAAPARVRPRLKSAPGAPITERAGTETDHDRSQPEHL